MSRIGHLGFAARVGVALCVAIVGASCSGMLGDHNDASTTSTDAAGDPTEEVLIAPYARSGWPTQHADSANDRHVPTTTADGYELVWSALQNAVVLSAPTVGADGRMFVTTALGEGRRNLHAFDAAGSILWESDAWSAPDRTAPDSDTSDSSLGVDSCAGLFSPVIDDAGDLYLTDCDQLWAFHGSGELKWVIDLPEAPSRSPFQDESRSVAFNPLSGIMIQPNGELVGTTVFGQLLVLDRETGEETVPSFTLPALPSEPTVAAVANANLWAGRDIDPQIIEPALQLQVGGVFPSPNVAAQDSEGTVYMVARSDVGDGWTVYAVEIDRSAPEGGSIFVLWNQKLGAAVASSPALSNDREQLYVSDQGGTVWAVGAKSGAVAWTAEIDAAGSPVAASPGGLIAVATISGGVVALSDQGEVQWSADLGAVTAYGEVDGLDGPIVRVVGAPVVTDSAVVANVEVSYAISDDSGSSSDEEIPVIGVPVHAEIVALSAQNGTRNSILATRYGDGNGQVTISTINGILVAPNSCARSTATSDATQEVAFRVRFAGYAADDMRCGVDAFRPTTRAAATS